MKRFLVFAAAFVAVSGLAQAELPASAPADASASIAVPLEIVKSRNLNFPVMLREVETCVDYPSTNTAKFRVQGDEGDYVFFDVPPHVDMVIDKPASELAGFFGVGGADNDEDMKILLNRTRIKHWDPETNANDPFAVGASNDPPVLLFANPHALSYSNPYGAVQDQTNTDPQIQEGEGQMYVWVGGCHTPEADQQRGIYKGSFIVTVYYD